MDLLIVGAITVFFGIAALSTIAQRNAPPAQPVLIVRADQLRERDGDGGDAGLGILLLFVAIVAAVWLL